MAEDEGEVRRHEPGYFKYTGPEIHMRVRSMLSFSFKYIRIARTARDSLIAYEAANVGNEQWFDEAFIRAVPAITFSYMAAEGAANEALLDLKIKGDLFDEIERKPLIEKCNRVLDKQNKAVFEMDDPVVRGIVNLGKIRNALIHPKAEWFDEQSNHAEAANRIQAAGITRSPLAGQNQPLFPIACMSASMATWCVTVSEDFIREFRNRLGLRDTI